MFTNGKYCDLAIIQSVDVFGILYTQSKLLLIGKEVDFFFYFNYCSYFKLVPKFQNILIELLNTQSCIN